MTSVLFDTLKFSRTLQDKAKLTPEQAEGVALAFAEASAEQMTTKSDLRDELAPIKSELLVVKWMAGFTLAAVMSVLFLMIRH
jgi:hypothetical protein